MIILQKKEIVSTEYFKVETLKDLVDFLSSNINCQNISEVKVCYGKRLLKFNETITNDESPSKIMICDNNGRELKEFCDIYDTKDMLKELKKVKIKIVRHSIEYGNLN